jgi:hypothetical protein
MKGISLLIRLAQYELEERRSDLGCINRAQTETASAIDALDTTVSREAGIAMTDAAAVATFAAWAGQAAKSRARLQSRIQELDVSAHAARDSLRDTAAQMRRLEIVLDTDREKQKRLSARRADAAADERELVRRSATTTDR